MRFFRSRKVLKEQRKKDIHNRNMLKLMEQMGFIISTDNNNYNSEFESQIIETDKEINEMKKILIELDKKEIEFRKEIDKII